MNNELAEDNAHKAKMLSDFFISETETEVEGTNKTSPHIERTEHSLDSIVITVPVVKDVLLDLNV